MMLRSWFLFCILTTATFAADDSAIVTNLPGLPSKPTFRHYSGYLRASSNHLLHYWFVESQSNPSSDPVLLWLNGGPGCSSLDGLLSEHGPFLIQDNGTLRYNPYSWNKKASVLYLEAPAGVGFSYSTNGDISTDDDQVARENHIALKDFFRKFPEFQTNEFFVTGESYAGVYIPTLTVLLLNDSTINLKGIAVGNGLSSFSYNDNSLIYFIYYHGLVGNKTWESLQKNCKCAGKERCFFTDDTSLACQFVVSSVSAATSGLNVYNLYGPCYNPQGAQSGVSSPYFKNLFRSNSFVSQTRTQLLKLTQLNQTGLRDNPPCINGTAATLYLNLPSVRAALHIPSNVQHWALCSSPVENHYKNIYREMSAQYKMIMQSKTRVLIYNGDVDMACNFLGDEWFFDDLNYPVDYSRRQWFTTNSYGRQVAGVSKSYANGQLVFTTIRGSGHMVPTDRPQQAAHMINTFINKQPL